MEKCSYLAPCLRRRGWLWLLLSWPCLDYLTGPMAMPGMVQVGGCFRVWKVAKLVLSFAPSRYSGHSLAGAANGPEQSDRLVESGSARGRLVYAQLLDAFE